MSKIKFPAWVEGPDAVKADRQRNRLKHLLQIVATKTAPNDARPYYTVVGEQCGISRETCYKAVRDRGYLSPISAIKIENTVGRDVMRAEWLQEPMLVNASKEEIAALKDNAPTLRGPIKAKPIVAKTAAKKGVGAVTKKVMTTTEKLLASPANKKRLLKSVADIKAGKAKVRELIKPYPVPTDLRKNRKPAASSARQEAAIVKALTGKRHIQAEIVQEIAKKVVAKRANKAVAGTK